jgi:hypothetical protein
MDKKTDYDIYYLTLYNLLLRITTDTNTLMFINEFIKRKINSTTQHMAKINTKQKFYKDTVNLDEIAY